MLRGWPRFRYGQARRPGKLAVKLVGPVAVALLASAIWAAQSVSFADSAADVPPIPTPDASRIWWPALPTNTDGLRLPEWDTPRKIGYTYYRLVMDYQAGRLTDGDRRAFDILPNDNIQVLVYCADGRVDEVVDLVTREQGRVLSREDNRLDVEVPMLTLLSFEQDPAVRRVAHRETIRPSNSRGH
jgi:hypothetical protein